MTPESLVIPASNIASLKRTYTATVNEFAELTSETLDYISFSSASAS